MIDAITNKISSRSSWLSKEVGMSVGDIYRWFRWVIGGKTYYESRYQEIVAGHKWVFILGCNNSGTSVLQRILDNSGQVSTWRYEGQRYTRVLPRAMRRGFERVWMEYEDDLRLKPGSEKTLGPRLVHDWMLSLKKPVKQIVLEKTPANLLRMQWLQNVFPDCYFIGLIRNGYAVAEGVQRKSHKGTGRAAHHWAEANKAMLLEAKGIKNFIQIRYEDFFARPDQVCQQLADYLDLDMASLQDAMTKKYSLKTIDGRGQQGLKNMNIASINRLSQTDITDIYNNASDMLDYFGYTSETDESNV